MSYLPKRSCQSGAVVAAYVRANTAACELRISSRKAIEETKNLFRNLKNSDEYSNFDEGINAIAGEMGIIGMMPRYPSEDEPTVGVTITDPMPAEDSETTESTSAADSEESEARVDKNVELNLITVEGDVNMEIGRD